MFFGNSHLKTCWLNKMLADKERGIYRLVLCNQYFTLFPSVSHPNGSCTSHRTCFTSDFGFYGAP